MNLLVNAAILIANERQVVQHSQRAIQPWSDGGRYLCKRVV